MPKTTTRPLQEFGSFPDKTAAQGAVKTYAIPGVRLFPAKAKNGQNWVLRPKAA
jgi:hypothetical protein